MKKLQIALRALSLLLMCALLGLFTFGCSDFGFQDKETTIDATNLAQNQTVITENGEKSAARLVDGDTGSVWKPGKRIGSLILDFKKEVTFNTIILREKGWNIKDFSIYKAEGVNEKGEVKWSLFYRQDKIEDYRLCSFERITTDKIMLVIDKSNEPPELAELEVYNALPVENPNFASCAYISNKLCVLGADAQPGEKNYLDPGYFDSISRVTMIGSGSLDDKTGEITLAEMPGTDTTYLEAALAHIREIAGERQPEIFHSGFYGGRLVFEEPLRSKAIQNILDFVLKYDLDGFDFDWEFPENHEQFRQLSDFIVDLKKAFEPYGKKISTAWYAWDISLSDEAIAAIDYVNVMGYDEYDQDGNICSFMSGALQPVQYFLDLGFRREQIVLGLPYYARAYVNGTLQDRFVNDRSRVGLTHFSGESDGFVFNSPQLIADKTAYAIHEQLGGVFCWNLMYDKQMNEDGCMTKVIQRTMEQRIAPKGEVLGDE